LAVLLLPVAVVLAACGSGGSTSAAANPSPTAVPSAGSAGGSGTGGARTFPGATGKVAALSGSTLEVQSTTAQTTVTFTSATSFNLTKTLSLSKVPVGECVIATGTPGSGTLTATSVRVSTPVKGSCSAAE
jgi:hypothetical protein